MSKPKEAAKAKRPAPGRPARRTFSVVLEQDEGGFIVASVPELRGCHTQARTMDEAMERIRESIALCLEDDGGTAPRTKFLGVATVDLATPA